MDYYQYSETQNIEPWLYSLCRGGFNEVASDFHIYRKKSYPYCNIHYVASGDFRIELDNQVYHAKTGEFFILPGYKEHDYKVIGDHSLFIHWIEFFGSDAIRLVERIIEVNQGPVIALSDHSEELRTLFNKLCTDASAFTKSTIIYEILMSILRISKCSQPTVLDTKGISFKELISYIEQHIGEQLQLDELSKHSGYSVSRLFELFKTEFNRTPKQYIYYRRINLAKKLLTNVDLSLEIIAEKTGFYDASHLVRRFKEQEGLTPKQYKREVLQYKIR